MGYPYYWKHPYIFRWVLYKFWGWWKINHYNPWNFRRFPTYEVQFTESQLKGVTAQSINDTWAFFQWNKNFQELPGTHASRRESMAKWPWPMCFWMWRLLGLYVAASPMQGQSCRCWPTPQIRGVIPEGRFGHTHRFSTVVERLDSQKHCMLGLQWFTFTFYSLNLDLLIVRTYLLLFSPWQGVRCFFVETNEILFLYFWCRLLRFVFWSS